MDSFQDQIFLDQSSPEDLFDRLPDEIVLSIFKRLHDAKSLCLSMCVCKRFHSIAPQIDEIFFPIPRKNKESDQETQKNSFKNLVIKTLIKPLHFISQLIKPKSKNDENDVDLQSFYVPNEALKPFAEMRSLHLRLPCHGNRKQGSNSKTSKNSKNFTTFLKWKAEFGRELQSCVMLGAKSLTEKPENLEKDSNFTERVIADDELKLRIVWTISCLTAASARHFLIQETVKQQKLIESVVVSDASEQGTLFMNRGQIEELREAKGKGDEDVNQSEYRSKVPALRMKMWYLQKLEMPDSGKVMEGATLVVIRPASAGDKVGKGRSDADLVAAAFGGEGDGEVIGEAIKKLMVAKKCYTLEMNAF